MGYPGICNQQYDFWSLKIVSIPAFVEKYDKPCGLGLHDIFGLTHMITFKFVAIETKPIICLNWKNKTKDHTYPPVMLVPDWCEAPPPLNNIWTLFKVESQTFSSQEKNKSSLK